MKWCSLHRFIRRSSRLDITTFAEPALCSTKAASISLSSVAAAVASPILIHAIDEAATIRQSIASANETKIDTRDFIMTATARSTEPVGPCSARRWP